MLRTAIAVALAVGIATPGVLAAQSAPSPIPNPQSQTPAPQSQTPDPQSPIPNLQSPIVRLDVANFCCPEYIAALKESVAKNWQQPSAAGTTTVRFVIERSGQIANVEVEQPSGVAEVDMSAVRAVRQSKLAPLPVAFNQPTLSVHLTFESGPPRTAASTLGEAIRNLQRSLSKSDSPPTTEPTGAVAPGTSIEFDTQGVDFGPWIRRFIARVRQNWLVPKEAMSLKGRAVVSFSLSKAGAVRDVKVVQPSGIAPFDQAALNAIVKSDPFDALPAAYPRDDVQFTVTFYYNEKPK